MHVAVDAGVYNQPIVYPYHLVTIRIEVFEYAETDDSAVQIWQDTIGGWNVRASGSADFSAATTVLKVASTLLGFIPIPGWPIISSALSLVTWFVPGDYIPFIGRSATTGTLVTYYAMDNNFGPVVQGTGYQDIGWHVYKGNTGPMGIRIVVTAAFVRDIWDNPEWDTTSVCLSIS
jgi:hypothetical protein